MRATTFCTPKVSRATRAARMLELSPLLTAAKACAPSMPASSLGVAVEADAGDPAALEAGAEAAEGRLVLVDHGDVVPAGLQAVGQAGAHPAAAHDHEVHEDLP
ncbi:hypothetical protein GCM10025868_05370 [Angustibacter aerolatus]|uniref:Uncharacterized protein n=1 Tax=Angustibacter aerolatus TaxID=1162965 RepID=A0ABQ6JAS6_9ACTN|nr:hypothetical protein GCM10025868_05370 [Angustibacter aerolatus]